MRLHPARARPRCRGRRDRCASGGRSAASVGRRQTAPVIPLAALRRPSDPGRSCRTSPGRGRRSRAAAACASPAGARRCLGERVGEGLGHGRHVGVRDRRVDLAAPSRSPRTTAPPGAASRRCRARARAGPAGIVARAPKNCTRTPCLDRSRSLSRHIAPPARRRSARTSERRLLAPGQRQHLHAEGLAEGDEAVEDLGGLQPFGDGGEGHAAAAPARRRRGPSSRMCGRAMTSPLPRSMAVAQPLLAGEVHPRDDLVLR